jgi:Uma2 family endonuclease
MSAVIEPDRIYSPDDLLRMPGGERYELVDGHLVEPNVSTLSSLVETRVLSRLGAFCESNDLGWVFSSTNMYRCFPHRPNLIRKPDASFIRRARLGPELLDSGIVTIAPDLSIEVISPNDEAEDLEIKVRDYLRAGVALVWLIFPIARSARVHRLDGSISGLAEEDDLDGEAVIPGFRCRLGELFPPPRPASA